MEKETQLHLRSAEPSLRRRGEIEKVMNTNDGQVPEPAAGTRDGWERREPSRERTAPGGLPVGGRVEEGWAGFPTVPDPTG